MYIQSPMEKFNKNNPFVILAKKEYYELSDNIQEFTRLTLIHQIIVGICFIIDIILALFPTISCIKRNTILSNTHIYMFLTLLIILALNILMIINFKKILKYYLYDNEGIIDFTKISEAEVNDILALTDEDLLQCLHKLYCVKGEFKQQSKYFLLNYKLLLVYECTELILILLIIF